MNLVLTIHFPLSLEQFWNFFLIRNSSNVSDLSSLGHRQNREEMLQKNTPQTQGPELLMSSKEVSKCSKENPNSGKTQDNSLPLIFTGNKSMVIFKNHYLELFFKVQYEIIRITGFYLPSRFNVFPSVSLKHVDIYRSGSSRPFIHLFITQLLDIYFV